MPLVVLVRHGIARELGEAGAFNDVDRPLSAEGIEKTEAAAKGFRKLDLKVDLVASSQLVRARQTRDIFLKAGGLDAPMRELACLAPDGSTAAVLRWLTERKFHVAILFGHNPNLQNLCSFLLSAGPNVAVDIKKCSATGIYFDGEVAAGHGALFWHLPPKILRDIGEAG